MRKIVTLALATMSMSCYAASDSLKNAVIENLYAMKSVYRAEYAPADWKRKTINYDLDTSFQEAITAINAKPDLTQTQAREILKNFIYSMQDYHVSIIFTSTEAASLPFTVKGAEDRFFLAYIDRSKLSESSFPFHIGDEIIYFGGKPVLEAVKEVQAQIPSNVPETDRGRAEERLTNREAARGYTISQGPITIGIKPNGSEKISNIQLIWDYTPEDVAPRNLKKASAKTKMPMMDVVVDESSDTNNPYRLGSRKAFTPDLGKKVWQTDEDNTFYAYTYLNAEGKMIGYVRIPSYKTTDYLKAVADFEKIITNFEANTSALVIDQVDNPGGSVFYLYALASMLTDQPLQTPLERMSINQSEVLDAARILKDARLVKTDEDAREFLKDDKSGYPHSYEFLQFILDYDRMIIAEWNAGHTLTKPYWIEGVNHINPAPHHYTHPILLLINHHDYSGGDFFPAILQDNKRVTTLGSRTAGAGGYVRDISIPNNIGINFFRVTESIAERANGDPIENLGVTPDIPYEMTAKDYQTNFTPYVGKIQAAVSALTK